MTFSFISIPYPQLVSYSLSLSYFLAPSSVLFSLPRSLPSFLRFFCFSIPFFLISTFCFQRTRPE